MPNLHQKPPFSYMAMSYETWFLWHFIQAKPLHKYSWAFQKQWFHLRNSFKPCGTTQSACLTCIYLSTQREQQTFAVQNVPQVLMSRISSDQELKGKDKTESNKCRGEFAASQQDFSTCHSKALQKCLQVYANCCCRKKSFIINTLWKDISSSLPRLVPVPAKWKRSALMRCQVCFYPPKKGGIVTK